jgi:hypothetical protein
MSAPTDKVQSNTPALHETTEKAKGVKEMKIVTRIGHTKTWVSKMMKTKFPVKLVSGVTLGALFLGVVVGFPFGFGSTGANDPKDSTISANVSGSSHTYQPVDREVAGYRDASKPLDVGPAITGKTLSRDEVTEFFGKDVVDALGYEVLTTRLSQYYADGQLSNREMESLDHEIGMLLAAAADKSSEARVAYNREIDRLEQRVTALLSDARSNPSTNLASLDREIKRLDDQTDMLRLAATEQQ